LKNDIIKTVVIGAGPAGLMAAIAAAAEASLWNCRQKNKQLNEMLDNS
jgi:predicted flavoprotein YhiN